jgi:adenosylcobinamide-phosphate synthase
VTAALLFTARSANPIIGDLVAIFLLYTAIATRDMVKHSTAVYDALKSGTIPEARSRLAMICGRDTDQLDESAIARGAVESVAENMVDGVTAPLLFAVIGGPVGAMMYKAVNTLDSTFGYKSSEYFHFGWASARIDDLANFIPARITAIFVPIAAVILGERAALSASIFLRDRGNHPSPNAGQTESAVAGALGVQLGGLSYYGNVPSHKPTLGDCLTPVEADHIIRANRLLLVSSALVLATLLAARLLVVRHVVETWQVAFLGGLAEPSPIGIAGLQTYVC